MDNVRSILLLFAAKWTLNFTSPSAWTCSCKEKPMCFQAWEQILLFESRLLPLLVCVRNRVSQHGVRDHKLHVSWSFACCLHKTEVSSIGGSREVKLPSLSHVHGCAGVRAGMWPRWRLRWAATVADLDRLVHERLNKRRKVNQVWSVEQLVKSPALPPLAEQRALSIYSGVFSFFFSLQFLLTGRFQEMRVRGAAV